MYSTFTRASAGLSRRLLQRRATSARSKYGVVQTSSNRIAVRLRSAVPETANEVSFVEEERLALSASLEEQSLSSSVPQSTPDVRIEKKPPSLDGLNGNAPPESLTSTQCTDTEATTASDDLDTDAFPDYMRVTLPSNSDPPLYSPPVDDDNVLKSKPTGTWNPDAPLDWSRTFGRRSPQVAEYLAPLVKLQPGDQGYFDVDDSNCNATIVRTKQDAKIVLERLYASDPSIYHACDTEVMKIDLKSVGPIGNGYVTCLSIYSGPDFDYGLGKPPGKALWIDNLDDAAGILQEFKPWLEDDRFKKVWHNYGFDRHVLWNEGIDCRGFAGDTMHMARLQDTSRLKRGSGYSLEALTEELLRRTKKPMKELFGIPRLRKDGTEGAIVDVPPVDVMQRDPKHRAKFIRYSCYDAEGTWLIREKLQALLESMPWIGGENLWRYYQLYLCEFGEVLTDMERRGVRVDAKDYLAHVEVQARKDRAEHQRKFRNWALQQIGIDGLAMNPASSTQLSTFLFGGAKNDKTGEPTEQVRVFKVPREDIPDEAFVAYLERDGDSEAEKDELDGMTATQLKEWCRNFGLKLTGKKGELQERIRGYLIGTVEEAPAVAEVDLDSMNKTELKATCIARGLPHSGSEDKLRVRLKDDIAFSAELLGMSRSPGQNGYDIVADALERGAKGKENLELILDEVKAKARSGPKHVEVTIRSIGMEPEKFTAGGAPSVTADVIRKLAGDPFGEEPRFGSAYKFFGEGDRGREACEALYSLGAIGSIDTMIANFLSSLQSLADEESRVHCSLNFNTETGRLSSRRPNLQNQPALEKDKYKIRKSFQSSPGNNLIVADYGQLELRLLASMTKCQSMIDAFQSGGDFHSRTALDMFDYVRQSVDDGECLLEWDYSKGDPPKPLLKDLFASERRKAKTLNFSIAYGKTAHGLSLDWGVSRQEAEEMLQAWYKARPEVEKWQRNTKKFARKFGLTRTLMGRYRNIPESKLSSKKAQGHGDRASINTPIQGGAADVAMMAMIKINNSEKLKRLGWILLLQIHDEVILEGPEETAEEAFEEVVKCMESPWVFGLPETLVPLLVDGSYTNTNWYDAK